LAEAAANTGYGLNVVESASLAPTSLESEKEDQRSLPL
jgi:hypothetical protein